MKLLSAVAATICALGASSSGQALYLCDAESRESSIEVGLGTIVDVHIIADLSQYAAAGVSLFVSFPSHAFVVEGADSSEIDGGPFRPGSLFADPVILANRRLTGPAAALGGRSLLAYAALLGPIEDRARTGKDLVASFRVQVRAAGEIRLHSDPIHETILVLADRRGERRFQALGGLRIDLVSPTAVPASSWGFVKVNATPVK